MLAAASPVEAMAKVRQKARLFQKPVRSRSGAREADNALDAGPDFGRRNHHGNRFRQAAKPRLPERNLRREFGLARHAELRDAPILGAQHAEHIFGCGEVVAVVTAYGVFVAHRSGHARSFNSPRLIQLFMVPSGTFAFAASSS